MYILLKSHPTKPSNTGDFSLLSSTSGNRKQSLLPFCIPFSFSHSFLGSCSSSTISFHPYFTLSSCRRRWASFLRHATCSTLAALISAVRSSRRAHRWARKVAVTCSSGMVLTVSAKRSSSGTPSSCDTLRRRERCYYSGGCCRDYSCSGYRGGRSTPCTD